MTLPGLGPQSSGALRFGGPSRGRIQGGYSQGVNYPSPFFDLAATYLPVTVKQLFRWCRYYFLTNPLINATVFKLSEYPITDIIIDHPSPEVVKRWSEYFQDHLMYRSFQTEIGLDYFVHGNGLTSVGFPFKKYLTCRRCSFKEQAEKIRQHWVFTNFAFRLTCPSCGFTGDAEARDAYIKNASGIKLIRWNVEDVEINYNDVTGEYTHFYTIPNTVRNDVVIGRKDIVGNIPQIFIQALKEQKGVVFSKENLFHLRRPTLAGQDRGWGIPLLLPVLKDTFYLQIMKKAQEAVLLEAILPMRVLFPQPSTGSSDPFSSINLVDWRDHVSAEINRWRMDPNHISVLPLPIGHQSIGGDGKALLLTGEIQQWSEQILVGMGVPREFIFGGTSYAGTTVSMRMVENSFIGYILRQKQLANFVMRGVASALDWPEVKIRFKPFKMADDIQRKAYLFQLNQTQKISDTTLLADSDLSLENENELMIKESASRVEAMKKQQLAMADIQGEAQMIMMKYQTKAQQASMQSQAAPQAPGEPGGPEQAMQAPGAESATPAVAGAEDQAGGQPAPSFQQSTQSQLNAGQRMEPGTINMDLPSLAMGQAKMISRLPKDMQERALMNLAAQSPELADLTRQMLKELENNPEMSPGATGQNGGGSVPGANGAAAAQVDMRPLPEQRPPRRAAGTV